MEHESATVSAGLCRALRVLRVFGVAPLRFTRCHTVIGVRLWNAQLYYGYFLSTILNVMTILGLIIMSTRNETVYQNSTTVGLVIYIINVISPMLIVSAAAYGAHKRMKYLLLQLHQLNKITIILPSYTMIVKDRKRTLNASVGMLVVLIAMAINIAITVRNNLLINSTKNEIAVTTLISASYVQHTVVIILEVQIVLIICTMRTAVESYNCELKRWLDVVMKEGDRSEATLTKLKKTLWRISRYYLTLCENVRQMNSREGALILLLMVVFVVEVMNNAYWFILVVHYPRSGGKLDGLSFYLRIAMRLFWTPAYVIMLGVLVNECNKMQEEIQKMRVFVSELMYRSRGAGEPILAAAGALCEQLSIHQPVFKPLDICALTRSLLITVITGVITYLVNVIRFHAMEENL